MDVGFYAAHMETLCELKELAAKHNCSIHFGVQNSNSVDMDLDLFKAAGGTELMYNCLDYGNLIENIRNEFGAVWFELYENNTGKAHSLKYYENTLYFEVERNTLVLEETADDYADYLKSQHQEIDNTLLYEDLYDWLDNHTDDNYYNTFCIWCRESPTIVNGFNQGYIKNSLVYRPGMALKFFSDYVCDYLNEKRIERVY